MKKSALFYCLGLLLVLSSCHRAEFKQTEAYKRTQELRNRYGKFVVGKWHDQLVSNRHKLYVYYLFAADGKYTKYAKEASRDSTTIGGAPAYGDWKTEEYFAEGRWYLKCSELDGRLEDKLVLEEKQVGGIVASINQFVYADEHVLVFRDIWYSRSPRTFHRGNPGSGF